MSRENVEVVRSLLEPFGATNTAEIDWEAPGLRDAFAAACSPELEVRTLDSGTGTGVDPVYRGLDGLARYLRDWLEPFSEYHADWLEFIDAGDYVLVRTSQWGIGAGSGARVEIDLAYACEAQDGLITRVVQYDTLAEARAATGSSAA
jgi:SnoaL-like domain